MDVATWLKSLGLGQYAAAFAENAVDFDLLPQLTVDDLRELGVGPIGHRRKLLDAIAALKESSTSAAEQAPEATAEHEAERRQLTILFADLVGSTELSRRLDPEETRELLRAYQDAVAAEIRRFEGHVAKFMGDGVLAYFGWPRAHEDEAERAVRAGLATVEAVGRLLTPTGERLAARVGIATGLVVVGGLIGEGSARERAVAGEAPNLAARLQEVAASGTVAIAASTRRLIGAGFEVEEMSPVTLKGFAEPICVWRIIGERVFDSRFAARATGLTPLVGREHELALLRDRWQEAREGDGQVILLAGEPGIGKSRITRALGELLADQPHAQLYHQCSPYYVDSALHPVIEQLELAAGLKRGDTPDVQLNRIEALLASESDQAAEAAPLIAELLTIPVNGRYPPIIATPAQQKEATLDVLVMRVVRLARERPVLCIFEDLHWVDPTTLELLDRLIGRIAHERVLAVLTFRAEFVPPWRSRPHTTLISLNRLSRRQSTALAETVVGMRALASSTLQEIVARADGVPLFVEELTKSVLETTDTRPELSSAVPGSLAMLPTVPVTLQDSLMARLDRLATAKEVAQIGAAIGRVFGFELIAAVCRLSEDELRRALDQLVASELAFVDGTPPAAIYSFKHALVRDVAYESLLKTRRQQLHAAIARELERRWPETRQTRPELLAHHFSEAGLHGEAMVHGLEAGRAAFRRSAVIEAVVHLQRALGLLGLLAEGDEHRSLELDLQIALGHALIAARGYSVPEVGQAFARARELAAAASDPAKQVSMLSGIGAYHYLRSESRAALRVGRDIVRVGRRGDDPATYVDGQRRIGGAFQQLGRLAPAQRHFALGWTRFTPEQEPVHEPAFPVEPFATHLALMSCNQLLLGYPDQARARRLDAMKLTRQSAHPLTLASTLHWASLAAYLLRDLPELERLVTEFVQVTTEHTLAHFGEWARIWQGWVRSGAEPDHQSVAPLEAALATVLDVGTLYWSPMYGALVADVHRHSGDLHRALEVLDKAILQVEQTDERVFEAELNRLKAVYLLAGSPPSSAEAEICLVRALMVARRQKARFLQLRAAMDLARLWQAQGKRSEARLLLEPIRAWFTEGADTPDLMDAEQLLRSLR